jgi:hypothetical protein
LSWFLDSYRGRRRFRHDGVDTGFQTDMVLMPDESLAVIVLANTIPAPVSRITDTIVDLLLGLKPELPKPPVLVTLGQTLSGPGIQAAAGMYRRLQETQGDHYDFGPEQFIDIGFTLREVRRYSQGLQVVQLGRELFPDSSALTELFEQLSSREERS